MDSCAITTFPSHALIAWLEQLLRGRLSSQISLSYDFESNHWKLTALRLSYQLFFLRSLVCIRSY